jgi:hypothetical protein
MKKRTRRRVIVPRVPRFIAPQIVGATIRTARHANAETLAKPMRRLFDLLARGEVHADDNNRAVMLLPDYDAGGEESWELACPAMLGWIDCWERIAPDIEQTNMRAVEQRLRVGGEIPPALVQRARAEFDRTVERFERLPQETINSGITTASIAWEFEKRSAA